MRVTGRIAGIKLHRFAQLLQRQTKIAIIQRLLPSESEMRSLAQSAAHAGAEKFSVRFLFRIYLATRCDVR